MAWRRVYGRCNMATLLHNQGIPRESINSILDQTSTTISSGFHGSRSVLNFDEVHGRTAQQFSEESNEDQTEIDQDEFSHHPEKKRRLTDDQVEYLEKSFETETRLEPERKIQLARELGLQPRQVAVWFQNRRARWRMKQLDKEFETLRSSYSTLQNDYDNLKKEKEKLTKEVLRLTDKLLHKKNNKEVEINKASTEKQKQSSSSIMEAKTTEDELVSRKQEEQSSLLSLYDNKDPGIVAMVDSDYSSSGFDADHSDLSHELSHLDEDEEIKDYRYVEGSSFVYEFPEEEHDLWLWR